MPELPEVETIKNELSKTILNARIKKADVFCNRFRMPIPNDLPERIENTSIKNIRRIAKYIIMDLDNNLSLIWHLGMSGRIKICPIVQKPEKHDHVVITTDKGIVIFNDARRFGLLIYSPTSELKNTEILQKIGFDPFDEKLNAASFQQKIKNKSCAIKIALLDQSIINGIGNIYASEALYGARISPLRKASSLTLSECQKLIESVRDVLQKAINAGGSTLKDYRRPDGSSGDFQNKHCVYNKTGKPCPDCCCNLAQTGGIKKIVLGGRSTFYCQTHQK